MSLIKKHAMSARQLAANRRNQKLCHGPVVDGGRERIGAALQRFGFDTQAEELAMRALGEDPAHFQDLLKGLWQEYDPAGASQEGVVISLARAMWLMNRAARMQEGYAVRQATEVNSGRQDRVHAQMMRLKMTEERLQRLVQAVANEYYVTTPEDLEKMKNLHLDGVLKDMGEIALALFYELQAPGTGEDGIDRDEMARRALWRIKDIFGLNSDTPPVPKVVFNGGQPQYRRQDAGGTNGDVMPASIRPQVGQQDTGGTKGSVTPACSRPPVSQRDAGPTAAEQMKRYPSITPAEWEARERPRQLLENILTRQMEACAAQRKTILKESVKGPSPYERAAEIAPTHSNAQLMRRMQDSNLHEVRRLTTLLLKIKRFERQSEVLKMESGKNGRVATKSAKRM